MRMHLVKWYLLTAAVSAVYMPQALAEVQMAASYLDLNLNQNRYLGGAQHAAQVSDYTVLNLDASLSTATDGFTYKASVYTEGAFGGENEFYAGVPELYVQPRQLAPWFTLTVGRQKRTWSRLDEEFNLGIWQPQLRWDYLNPVQQGLTGVFFDWSLSSSMRLTFFTSAINIPDQGPNFRVRDGGFESSNRWFIRPQSQIQIFQDDALLGFKLEKPSVQDLAFHSSFGLGLHYQNLSSPFWMQVNYAYKPRNQVHIGIECEQCLDIGAPTGEITAIIHPKIVQHHVFTWEAGFEKVDDQGWLSLTADVPQRSGFPDAFEEAPLDPMLIAGAAYRHYIRSWIRKPSWLQYSYMRTWQIRREGTPGLMGSDEVESSFDRYPFRELAALDWRVQISRRGKSEVNLRTRYSYSLPERGGWLSAQAEWQRGPATFSFGFDVLGSDIEGDSRDAGMFTRYRANDRIFGGMSYVF